MESTKTKWIERLSQIGVNAVERSTHKKRRAQEVVREEKKEGESNRLSAAQTPRQNRKKNWQIWKERERKRKGREWTGKKGGEGEGLEKKLNRTIVDRTKGRGRKRSNAAAAMLSIDEWVEGNPVHRVLAAFEYAMLGRNWGENVQRQACLEERRGWQVKPRDWWLFVLRRLTV